MSIKIDCSKGAPDAYVHGDLSLDTLDAGFAQAFAAPRPAVFDGDDKTRCFVDVMGDQNVSQLWRLDRRDFASKLDIYILRGVDLAACLLALARGLGQPVVVDIGKDITDDSAVLFTPTGKAAPGLLVSFGDYYPDESRDVAFIDDAGDRFVVA